MLLPPEKVHHFEDIGYRHDWYYQCPANAPGGQLLESAALGEDRTFDQERPGGIGCRCECDGSRTRNYPTFCQKKLRQPSTAKVVSQWEWIWSRWW
jgi:mannosyltransferase